MTTHNAYNERTKRRYFAYLKEAKRHSEPTVDAVAKALARFESDTKHRDFKLFHFEQRTLIDAGAMLICCFGGGRWRVLHQSIKMQKQSGTSAGTYAKK